LAHPTTLFQTLLLPTSPLAGHVGIPPYKKRKKRNKRSKKKKKSLFVCPYLDTVVTGDDASILHLDVGWRVGEFAFRVGAGALGALELAADLQLEPARVFGIDHVI
jgi:hypothetical protein